MKVLITGADGFIGNYLYKRLESKNFKINTFQGDITSFHNVDEQIKRYNPEVVFHLAGISNIADCEQNPDIAFSVNVQGTFNLLESIKRQNRKIRFIFPSTSHVYRPVLDSQAEIRIAESFSTLPQTVYATSKLLSEKIINEYFECFDIGQAILFRLFNHTHSSQKGPFFFPQLYEQILKNQKEIKVGDLEVFRDFSLVTDLIDLFEKSCTSELKDKINLFNICSGQPRKLFNLAIELAKALNVQVEFKKDTEKIRKGEPKFLIGSNDKIRAVIGWGPSELSDKEFIQSFLKPIKV